MNIILTSAIIDYKFEERKEEYVKSLNFFSSKKLDKYINVVETVIESNSFIEELGYNVFYSKTFNPKLKNKGVKEINALKKFFDNTDIPDDEIILKLTGRYRFEGTNFIDIINKRDYDVYYLPVKHQVFFGCFAIKKKYLVEFINNLNVNEMELNMINVELMFAKYIKSKNFNKYEANKLDLYSNINNQSVVIW